VLDSALDAVSEAVVAGVVAVGGCDVALAVGCSGLERGGCGGCRSGLDRPGSVCRRFPDVRGSSEAGDRVVVVVDDSVDAVDGVVDVADRGCVGIVGSDVAKVRGGLVGLTKVWVAISLVLGVVWVLESANDVVLAFFSELRCSSSGGSVCRAAHRRSGGALSCAAVSSIPGVVWVPASLRVVSASFDAMAFATSVTSIKLPSSTDTQWP
jgi:hypothetical protein